MCVCVFAAKNWKEEKKTYSENEGRGCYPCHLKTHLIELAKLRKNTWWLEYKLLFTIEAAAASLYTILDIISFKQYLLLSEPFLGLDLKCREKE